MRAVLQTGLPRRDQATQQTWRGDHRRLVSRNGLFVVSCGAETERMSAKQRDIDGTRGHHSTPLKGPGPDACFLSDYDAANAISSVSLARNAHFGPSPKVSRNDEDADAKNIDSLRPWRSNVFLKRAVR